MMCFTIYKPLKVHYFPWSILFNGAKLLYNVMLVSAIQHRESDINTHTHTHTHIYGFPGGSDGKESAWNVGGLGLIPGPGRSPEEWNGYPLQFSCPGSPKDIHISTPSWASILPPHPTPLGGHRAPAELPVLYSSFPISVFHMVVYIWQCYFLN